MFIMGTTIVQWFKLLIRNGFDVSLRYVPRAFFITLVITLLSPLVMVERLIYQKKIMKTEVKKPPIFILGHFRNGTTHVQNLLSRDKRLGYLTISEGTCPHIFISCHRLIHLVLKNVLPKKRPMDDMNLSDEFPGEHDWSLANMCLLSPYTGIHFSEHLSDYIIKYGNFATASEKELKLWKKNLNYLIKKLTLKKKGKQLVLKSPLDTARLKILFEMFPDAKFIHIYRNPYEVFFNH